MKLALNGAVTIGTLDGANVEILEEVGSANIFIFGNTVEQVDELRRQGYDPHAYYQRNEELKAALDWLASGYFAPTGRSGRYRAQPARRRRPVHGVRRLRGVLPGAGGVDRAFSDRARWAGWRS
jgi:starch phosphorylase